MFPPFTRCLINPCSLSIFPPVIIICQIDNRHDICPKNFLLKINSSRADMKGSLGGHRAGGEAASFGEQSKPLRRRAKRARPANVSFARRLASLADLAATQQLALLAEKRAWTTPHTRTAFIPRYHMPVRLKNIFTDSLFT